MTLVSTSLFTGERQRYKIDEFVIFVFISITSAHNAGAPENCQQSQSWFSD